MKDLSIEEFEVLLCSTGYLPPRNEDELSFFSEMYCDYKSRLEDRYVDIEAILNGSCKMEGNTSHGEERYTDNHSCFVENTSNTYSMAARNYSKLPDGVLDKMRKQHIQRNGHED